MPLYTRLGDTGQTMLYGGETLSKAKPRIHAYGTIDELNALIGVILMFEDLSEEHRLILTSVQHGLYRVGADLATPFTYQGEAIRIEQSEVDKLEYWVDSMENQVPQLTHFILPGGCKIGSLLHQARTVCRRAERWMVQLGDEEDMNFAALRYINRLGDLLFAMARVANKNEGIEEISAGEMFDREEEQGIE